MPDSEFSSPNDSRQESPKRKNRKLQVIDLTEDAFEFSDHGFSITGFIASDGREWFSARIACDNLGLGNPSRAISSLPYEDKSAIVTRSNNGKIPVRHLMVSRSGLFRLIFKSKKSEAVNYQDWVFDEVLPAIHERGGYISPTATNQQIVELQNLLDTAQHKLEDMRQVNRWLGGKQGAGRFIEASLPKRDRE